MQQDMTTHLILCAILRRGGAQHVSQAEIKEAAEYDIVVVSPTPGDYVLVAAPAAEAEATLAKMRKEGVPRGTDQSPKHPISRCCKLLAKTLLRLGAKFEAKDHRP